MGLGIQSDVTVAGDLHVNGDLTVDGTAPGGGGGGAWSNTRVILGSVAGSIDTKTVGGSMAHAVFNTGYRLLTSTSPGWGFLAGYNKLDNLSAANVAAIRLMGNITIANHAVGTDGFFGYCFNGSTYGENTATGSDMTARLAAGLLITNLAGTQNAKFQTYNWTTNTTVETNLGTIAATGAINVEIRNVGQASLELYVNGVLLATHNHSSPYANNKWCRLSITNRTNSVQTWGYIHNVVHEIQMA